jgi:hypothetical protein
MGRRWLATALLRMLRGHTDDGNRIGTRDRDLNRAFAETGCTDAASWAGR